MCISVTEAINAIRISMHSQRYDTYEAASDEMRYDSPLLRCSVIRFQINSTQFDAMDNILLLLFLWFRKTTNHKLTYSVSSDF